MSVSASNSDFSGSLLSYFYFRFCQEATGLAGSTSAIQDRPDQRILWHEEVFLSLKRINRNTNCENLGGDFHKVLKIITNKVFEFSVTDA